MGNVEHIEQLETYIKDLGKEIKNVKKASDYLRLIEEFQTEIINTSTTLNQTKEQLKLIQEIVESKLELFHSTSKNIEAKQQALEQSQTNISASLAELKQQQEKSEKGIISSFSEMHKVVIKNHDVLVTEINQVKEDHGLILRGMSKTNKIFFTINTVLSVSVLGVLLYLLTK